MEVLGLSTVSMQVATLVRLTVVLVSPGRTEIRELESRERGVQHSAGHLCARLLGGSGWRSVIRVVVLPGSGKHSGGARARQTKTELGKVSYP
jgi:hypothetical protein